VAQTNPLKISKFKYFINMIDNYQHSAFNNNDNKAF